MIEDINTLEKIKSEISILNPLANIVMTNYSVIDMEFFLEESINSTNNSVEKDLSVLNNKNLYNCWECCYVNNNKPSCKHLKLIENLVLRTTIDDIGNLDKTIGKILWDLSEEFNFKIIRIKGLIKNNEGKVYSLQGLYDLYELNEVKITENNCLFVQIKNKEFVSKILFIGKNLILNKNILEDNLK